MPMLLLPAGPALAGKGRNARLRVCYPAFAEAQSSHITSNSAPFAERKGP